MAAYKTACPHCGIMLSCANAPRPGTKLRCPRCSTLVPVAGQVAASPAPELDEEPEPRPAQRRKRGKQTNSTGLLLVLGGGAALVLIGVVAGALLIFWPFPRTGREAAAVALIEKAIQASGAEEQTRYAGIRRRGSGFFKDQDRQLFPGSLEDVEDIACSRGHWVFQAPQAEVNIIEVVNGNEGWEIDHGVLSMMSKADLAESQALMYLTAIETLLPLREERFSLVSLGDLAIHGRPSAGVAVNLPGQAEIKLYFDKESWLLVKSERRRRIHDPNKKGLYNELKTEEFLFGDYQRVQGIAVPMKCLSKEAGVTLADITYTEVTFLDRLDERLFKKP